ncbi:MAG: OmpA family protein [Gemmatimonadota bacterium]
MLDKLMANGRVAVHDIYFDVGTAEIRPESNRALSAISALLREQPALHLTVEAHTDSVGAPESNLLLSGARAAAVVAYLVRAGIEPGRLRAAGRGATQPVVPNDSPPNRQRNRRIELVIERPIEAG